MEYICGLNDAWRREIQADLSSPECNIDPGMAEAVSRINALGWIATTQCCEGHGDNEGYLSVAVSLDRETEFQSAALGVLEAGVRLAKVYEPYSNDTGRVRFVFWFLPKIRERFLTLLLSTVEGLERDHDDLIERVAWSLEADEMCFGLCPPRRPESCERNCVLPCCDGDELARCHAEYIVEMVLGNNSGLGGE